MPFKKGQAKIEGSGRTRNTPNKATLLARSAQEILDGIGCDPILGMATIALNQLPCGVCRGELKTRYKLAEPRLCNCNLRGKPITDCWKCSGTGQQTLDERICQSCYATGMESCNPELRGKMYDSLAKYVHPQRKAVEMSDPGRDAASATLIELLQKRRRELAEGAKKGEGK